jgi:acetyl-CoA acetyltransferase
MTKLLRFHQMNRGYGVAARVSGTLVALETMCIGGGQGLAAVFQAA